jgi:hypothetical protein
MAELADRLVMALLGALLGLAVYCLIYWPIETLVRWVARKRGGR